jgi:hypothetical protein
MTRHLTLAFVLLGLFAAGCGGSNHTAATSTARPAPHAGVAARCAAQAHGEPGAMGLCLAAHGVRMPSGGALVRCAEAANTRAEVTACLSRAAR